MGAMKKLDHDLAELIESINPDSPMLGDSPVAWEAREILMSELLERGWVPPTLARAHERRADKNNAALVDIAISLGSREDWNLDDLADAAVEISDTLVELGMPSPQNQANTGHYVELEAARDANK